MFTLPDHLMAYLYLMCAAIPRFVPKNAEKKRGSHTVIVGDEPGDIWDLSSWIFLNIPEMAVSYSV
jgi:hypothetical protein